jgi:hypothetical protein
MGGVTPDNSVDDTSNSADAAKLPALLWTIWARQFLVNVRFWHKADIAWLSCNVRFQG